MRVLLTAFGPFPGAPFNSTVPLVKALTRRRRPALAGITYATHVFATTYASVDRDLPKLLANRPDIVLMFGLAGRTRHLRVETRARNAFSVLFPDASGYCPRHNVIKPGGPSSLKGCAPFVRLVSAGRGSGFDVRASRDAGRYLCNYAFWRALERAGNGAPLVQFVHIPLVRSRARRRRPVKHRPATLGQLVDASEAILVALLAASRH